MFMRVEIRDVEKIKLKNPVIIEGFPGIGMVGTICATYLTEKLGMKLVGYITSTHFPPISTIHDYKPVSPARIYASEKYNVIVLFSEFVILSEIVFPLSERIIEYAKDSKAKAIYSLAGIAVEQPSQKMHGIASTDAMADLLKSKDVELIKEGATQGVSGVLIAECAADGFPAANIMAETGAAMDPKAAARLLEKLSEIIGVPIDTKPLLQEGEKIETKMRQALTKMKTMNNNYQKMEDNPMYA